MSLLGDGAGILNDLSVNSMIFIGALLFTAFLIWDGSVNQVLLTVSGYDIQAIYIPALLFPYFLLIHLANQ